MALQQFGVQHPETANDPVFKYVDQLYRVAPGVLTEHGKTKSAFSSSSVLDPPADLAWFSSLCLPPDPYPNVDVSPCACTDRLGGREDSGGDGGESGERKEGNSC